MVGQWISKWQAGGLQALKVGKAGKPKGSGSTLDVAQQKSIQKSLIEKTPDQLKMNFALWTRHAVQQFIKQDFGVEIPIRTVGDYLKRWGFTPQKPIKRAYERNDQKIRAWRQERERVNMISTVTKLGKIRFMFYEGKMNSKMLIEFMKRLTKGSPKKLFLILDNLPPD